MGIVALPPMMASVPLRRLFDLWLQQLYRLMVDFEDMEPLQVRIRNQSVKLSFLHTRLELTSPRVSTIPKCGDQV